MYVSHKTIVAVTKVSQTYDDIPRVQLPAIMVHNCRNMVLECIVELRGGKGIVDPRRELTSPETSAIRQKKASQ